MDNELSNIRRELNQLKKKDSRQPWVFGGAILGVGVIITLVFVGLGDKEMAKSISSDVIVAFLAFVFLTYRFENARKELRKTQTTLGKQLQKAARQVRSQRKQIAQYRQNMQEQHNRLKAQEKKIQSQEQDLDDQIRRSEEIAEALKKLADLYQHNSSAYSSQSELLTDLQKTTGTPSQRYIDEVNRLTKLSAARKLINNKKSSKMPQVRNRSDEVHTGMTDMLRALDDEEYE